MLYITENILNDVITKHHASSHTVNEALFVAYCNLYDTMYLAISAEGGEPTRTFATKINSKILHTFFGTADASFGDNVEIRRSSAGYMFILHGMPID
jgi:hypothetical protein